MAQSTDTGIRTASWCMKSVGTASSSTIPMMGMVICHALGITAMRQNTQHIILTNSRGDVEAL